MSDIYVTALGEVKISSREAQILDAARIARRELAGSPFLKQAPARNLLAKADAIEKAILKVACYRWEAVRG